MKNCYNVKSKQKALVLKLLSLARLRRSPAAFLLNGAITRPATGSITFGQPFPSYMQSFIKIGVLVVEKSGNKTMTLCNFNNDVFSKGSYSKALLDWKLEFASFWT